jgi:hypothetical protein
MVIVETGPPKVWNGKSNCALNAVRRELIVYELNVPLFNIHPFKVSDSLHCILLHSHVNQLPKALLIL